MPNVLDSDRRTAIPRAVLQMCGLMIVLGVLSVAFNLFVVFNRFQVDGSILSPSVSRFGDFTIYQSKFAFFHQSAFFSVGYPFTYPAPVALVYEFFFRGFGGYALGAFLVFCTLAFVVPACMLVSGLRRRGLSVAASTGLVGVLVVTSWPMILVFDRGNMEVLIWVALAGAVYAYSTGRGYVAACLFGMAAACKLFPFVFLALFFSRKEWGKLVVGLAVFVGVSVLSLEVLGPSFGVAYHQIAVGLDFFRLNYMAKWQGRTNGIDHSMFSFYKFLVKVRHNHWNDFRVPLGIYLKVTAVSGVALYFLRIRKLPMMNQLLCLSIASIYFTAFSGDATLLHLYYSLVLLVFLSIRAEREGKSVAGLRPMLLLLGFVLSVTTFLTWRREMLEGEFKCIALGALLVLALTQPLGPPLGEEWELADTALPV